ncbi:MAG: nitroreductase family protein [Candidatus Woesearchaeota archaeon]
MANIWHLIDTRRSIRSFKDIPVEQQVWGRLATIVGQSPSSGNLHNVKCIVVEQQKHKERLASACYAQVWIAQAPLVFVLTANTEYIKQYYGQRGAEVFTHQDTAAAAMAIQLAAHDVGLASCWVSSFDEAQVRHALDIPDNQLPCIVLPLGYPAESVPTPARPRAESYVFRETFGNKIEDVNVVYGRSSAIIQKTHQHTKKYIKDLVSAFWKR